MPARIPHIQVAAALIWEDGKLLLAQRLPGSHLGGFWEFPGGKQEPGESLPQCLEREVEEELGLKIRAVEPLLTVEHAYESKHVSLHVFRCVTVSGKPRAIEVQEIRWVEPAELRNYRLPPPDYKIIERLNLSPP